MRQGHTPTYPPTPLPPTYPYAGQPSHMGRGWLLGEQTKHEVPR